VTAQIDLVATEGALEGTRIPLHPQVSLLIGRSNRGLQLPDPLVSIEHAEIAWTTDRYFILDLGSLTGTFVDGRRLAKEPVALKAGMLVRIGESTFRLDRRRERSWVLPMVVLAALGAGLFFLLAWTATRPVRYDPLLGWHQPIRQGTHTHTTLVVPPEFSRKYGLDHRTMRVTRVSDYDQDGFDEVWLQGGNQLWVITFEGSALASTDGGPDVGDWRILGTMPLGCYDGTIWDFPDLRCGGELYQFRDGAYRVAGQDGLVVWMPGAPTPAAPIAGAIPYRFTLVETARLAGFLAARGVVEPIHYLVCEEAIPGVRGQVLTQDGRVVQLDFGCFKDIGVIGTSQFENFGSQSPVAVAFTSAGRTALIADVKTYLSGSEDGLFLSAPDAAIVQAMSAEPLPRVMMRVAFDGSDMAIDPLAAEQPVPAEPRGLVAGGSARAGASPLATTAAILEPGTVTLDPPGCSVLEVTTGSWHCSLWRLCFPNRTFLEVRQVGCGAPHPLVSTAYGGGVIAGADGNVEVRALVEGSTGANQVDVVRARVAYRLVEQAPVQAEVERAVIGGR
jgi:hypothetical protein